MTGMPKTREALIRAVNGNPVTADQAWAVIHGWDAMERVVEAARELHSKYVDASTADEEGLLQITHPSEMRALWSGVDAAADVLDAALAELDGQTPEADTSAGEAPAGRPSASGACPCRVHGDPDGDCGERCP